MPDDKTPIIRRQITKELNNGDFSTIALVHMVHYDASVECYLQESKRLGRPISVANVGAGDLWDLRVLIHGRKVKKSEILKSYYAFDIEYRDSPFGQHLTEQIKYKCFAKDMMQDPTLQLKDNSIDVVISTEFIEHIDQNSAIAIMKEMYRILRPGGLLYLTTPNAANSSRSDKYHIYEWKLDELLNFLIGEGFHVESCYGTYIDQRTFNEVNDAEHIISDSLLVMLKNRFTSNYLRVIVATPYPGHSNGVAVSARKI